MNDGTPAADCLFCKIFSGAIAANEVVRTDDVLVFRDLNPQAPHHVLAIPKRHAENLGDFVAAASADEVGDLFAVASRAGRAASPTGYRIVVNEGVDAGQTVFHLHLHVLAGRNLDWPAGLTFGFGLRDREGRGRRVFASRVIVA